MVVQKKNLLDCIKSVLQEQMDSETMFTSLNISNEVKDSGFICRHREVAQAVRELYRIGWFASRDYTRTLEQMDNGNVAFVYHHISADSEDYNDRDLQPLPPKSVDLLDSQDEQTDEEIEEEIEEEPETLQTLCRSVMIGCPNGLPIDAIVMRLQNAGHIVIPSSVRKTLSRYDVFSRVGRGVWKYVGG